MLNGSKTILQPIKDSSPADHDRSANESRSVTRRIMISYPMNQRLFTNRSKTLCQRTRDFSPTNQRLLTNQSRISHSNNQIFFYNRYNAFINLFRILSITNYTMILTIPLYQLYHAHFSVLIKNFTQQEYFFHPFNFLRYIFLSPFWYP